MHICVFFNTCQRQGQEKADACGVCALQVFYRERAVLMYTPLAFGFATLLAELPYIFAQTTVFVPIVSAAAHWCLIEHACSVHACMPSYQLVCRFP